MKQFAIGILLALLLTACGGGGGGSDPPPSTSTEAPAADRVPPSVTSYLPNSTARVSRETEISATFSEPLATSTLTQANVRVTRKGTAVAGTLSYDAANRKVTFAPQEKLDLHSSYAVTVGTGVQDLSGNGLAAEQSWTFETADGSWRGARRLDPPGAASIVPEITISDGLALALWSAPGTSGSNEIRTATYSATTGWGTASTVSATNANAVYPKLGFDDQGNALAVWVQAGSSADGGTSVWAARYLRGQGWQVPVEVDPYVPAQEVSLAVDASGNAVAVFTRTVGPGRVGNADAWAARFTISGGWQASTRLGSTANIGSYDQAIQPQAIFDGAGNAHVLWVQTTSDNPVWYARTDAGGTWQPAVNVGATRRGDPYGPRLAVASSGQVMALWNAVIYAGGPYRFDLWWSTLPGQGSTWTPEALLETDDAGDAYRQRLVADSAGNFHAVWQQYGSTYSSEVRHRQYTPGTAWGVAAAISDANGSFDQNGWPSLVADRNGNLMALWGVYASGNGDPQEGTFARRFLAGAGWQSVVRIGETATVGALATSLGVATDGSVAAAWMEPPPLTSAGPVSVNVFE